jgi:hypothetical protein
MHVESQLMVKMDAFRAQCIFLRIVTIEPLCDDFFDPCKALT